jgi:hypothetical protein
MSMTFAGLLAQTLSNAEVKRIWGVTGDSLNGLNDSLRRLGRTRMKSEWPSVPTPGERCNEAWPALDSRCEHYASSLRTPASNFSRKQEGRKWPYPS